MDLSAAAIAGLVGAVVLTALLWWAPRVGLPRFDLLRLLGTGYTPRAELALGLGGLTMLLNGVAFAFLYVALWTLGAGQPNAGWGCLFGLVHGALAAALVPALLRLHPRPPRLEVGAAGLAGLIAAHILYGVTVALIYGALAGPAALDVRG